MIEPRIRVLPDAESIIVEVAERIVELAELSATSGILFSLFLSGGSTPKALYERLAGEQYKSLIDWRSVEIYFGDERCVPPESELSNYKMAHDTLISKVPIPPQNVFRMKGEIDPQQAAKEYGQMLKERFFDEGPDLLLLGMGDDGHTASLFPNTEALKETHHRCVANHVPYDYIPAGTNWRLTLTYPFINRSREVAILVTGASKAKRVSEILEGDEDHARLPIQGVKPDLGNVTWYMDVGAAGMNEEE
ncbi:MAG TPA: 6-phosphogluconolactonase [Tepidisphaeraceae bacterium]|jgi:6-phosphogluconolactonase